MILIINHMMQDSIFCLIWLYLYSDELADFKFQIMQLNSQVDNIFATLDQSIKPHNTPKEV